MEQPQGHLEGLGDHRPGHVAVGLVAVESGLDGLEVPVGQVVPEEAVSRAGGVVQAQLVESLGRLQHGGLASGDDPAVGQGELVPADHVGEVARQRPHRPRQLGEDQAAHVPELVGEVPARREGGLDVAGVEEQVGA